MNGTCGGSAYTCNGGSSATNTGNDAGYNYTWQCAGENGGATANCTTPAIVACGSDNDAPFGVDNPPWTTAAVNNLCVVNGAQTAATSSNGTVKGGRITWNCGSVACSANTVTTGSDNGATFTTWPSEGYPGYPWNGLCAVGGSDTGQFSET